MGAALSYFITIFCLNLAYWLFVKIKFKLQPLNKSHLYILLIGLFGLITRGYLPTLNNLYFDMLSRYLIVTIQYCVLAYFFNISSDLNLMFDQIFKKKKVITDS